MGRYVGHKRPGWQVVQQEEGGYVNNAYLRAANWNDSLAPC